MKTKVLKASHKAWIQCHFQLIHGTFHNFGKKAPQVLAERLPLNRLLLDHWKKP
jgi:hypothetical protein